MRIAAGDTGTPRSVREKLGTMNTYLKQPLDDSTKISNSSHAWKTSQATSTFRHSVRTRSIRSRGAEAIGRE